MDSPTLMLLLFKTTALLAVGATVAAVLRRSPAGARHLVWLATLAGVLALPLLARLAPLRLEVLPAGLLTPAEPAPSAAGGLRAASDGLRSGEAPAPVVPTRSKVSAKARAAPADANPRWWLPEASGLRGRLGALWITGGLGVLAYLAMGAFAVRRIVRSARPVDDPAWASLLAEAADRLDLDELPRLVVSDRVGVPFACGVWSATVVLPASATDWSDERRRLVLFHELAHVSRRDLLGHTLGRLACAAYWFHPLVWAAARRLRAESERACDDVVLDCGTRASDYADHLLDIVAGSQRGRAPATALPIARRREFEGRVLAILDPGLRRGKPRPVQAAVLLAGLSTLAVTVAASAPARPTSSEPTPLAVASNPSDAPTAPEATPAPASAAAPVAAGNESDESESVDRDGESDRDESGDDEKPKPLDPGKRATLLKVLRTDADASVRRTAAWALERSRDAESAAALGVALRGDASAEVREMAAWALAAAPGPESAAVLREALRADKGAEVRRTAAWALGQRRLTDSAPLVAAAADSSPEVREVAIWAIGNQRLAKAPDALVAALRDEHASVRLVAAWALGEIRDAATAPALRTAFDGEKDDEVRRAVFRAAMLVGDPSTELLDRALSAKDPELRSRAVQLLAGPKSHARVWRWPRPEPRPFP